ncbi:MAG: DivIVA domain-containing protein [Clostridia bacterium]|nr:DivIVA domain-containing protein [Clostridia bacterium]
MTRTDIIEKEFSHCFFGYSPDEVDEFLDELADELFPPADHDAEYDDDMDEEELLGLIMALEERKEHTIRRIELLKKRYDAIMSMMADEAAENTDADHAEDAPSLQKVDEDKGMSE